MSVAVIHYDTSNAQRASFFVWTFPNFHIMNCAEIRNGGFLI